MLPFQFGTSRELRSKHSVWKQKPNQVLDFDRDLFRKQRSDLISFAACFMALETSSNARQGWHQPLSGNTQERIRGREAATKKQWLPARSLL